MSKNIVVIMEQLRQLILTRIEDDNKKYNDPDWELVNIHIGPPSIVDLMTSADTPQDVKHLLFLQTFIGQQWVNIKEENQVSDGKLIFKDESITGWEL